MKEYRRACGKCRRVVTTAVAPPEKCTCKRCLEESQEPDGSQVCQTCGAKITPPREKPPFLCPGCYRDTNYPVRRYAESKGRRLRSPRLAGEMPD